MNSSTRPAGRAAAITSATLLLLFGGPAAWPALTGSDAAAATVTSTKAWYPDLALADLPDSSAEPGTVPGPGNWQPPPVDMTQLPTAAMSAPPASTNYQQKDQCVSSGVTGTPLTKVPPAQAMLDIGQAQQLSTGKNVTVAVIDTGVNPHPFLDNGGRLTGGGDYVAPSAQNNGTVDCDGHGTITAGIVAADTRGSGLGFIGVAPDASILAIRQTSQVYTTTDATGQETTAGTTQSLAEAIRHAADTPGVGVITTSLDDCIPATDAANLSNSGSGDPELQAAVHYAVTKNIVVVNSAGNVGSTNCEQVPQNDDPDPNNVKQIEIPAVYADDVLSVASVDPATGSVSSFSEWGPWVSVAAPGEGIYSVDPGRGASGLANLYTEPGTTTTNAIQGTSFAAPYVAGLAALIRAKYPTMSAREVMYRIEATAQHPSGPDGRNNQVGYGVINPVAALTALVPGQNGVPIPTVKPIPARAPNSLATDSLPMRIALIGIAGAGLLLLLIYFTVRTNRHNRQQRTG
ncbi:MAG TPA: type VII secretion-associated serine protease mycosin [Pseudonocardiaceae bacterium]|jgi:membrane-anchored mycosin MYCP|nr:type VII secretion-associated serine protease mycosin [Pseudonocardiaceae bacterium]